MTLTEAASGFLVFLLSVSVVQGQTCTPTHSCALKGSTVEIRCTCQTGRCPIGEWNTLWYTKINGDKPLNLKSNNNYSGRVKNSCSRNTCTLTISNLKMSDSAVYYFSSTVKPLIDESAVTLSVTAYPDLQVEVDGSYRKVKCRSSCHFPGHHSYIWYKNGKKVWGERYYLSVQHTRQDSYSCALSQYEDFPSPSVCVSGQDCNRVSYTNRSICALRGSSVDISCSYNSHEENVESKFWFRHQRSSKWQRAPPPVDVSEDSWDSGRVQVLESERGRSTLRITDLRETDSAEYRFKFKTRSFEWEDSLPGTTLTVTDIHVKVSQYGSQSKLTCDTSCHLLGGSSYVWFKNGQRIVEESIYLYFYSTSYSYEDSYSCAIKGLENYPSPTVCVSGQNCNKVIYTKRSLCVLEGSSVTFSCYYLSLEHVIESKFWFTAEHSHEPKDLRQDLQFSGRAQVSEEWTGHSSLSITDLRQSDSANYRFKFKTSNFEWGSSFPGTTLTVTALQVQVTRIITVRPSYTEAELKCHSSCSPVGRFSYIWFKNGEKMLEQTSSFTHKFLPEDKVSCAFGGYEDKRSPSVYAPKLPSVSVTPGEIVEGSSVTLTCSSDANPAATYTWYKENKTQMSKQPQLVFSSIQSSDYGEYYCTAKNELGTSSTEHFVNVKYAPKLPSVSVTPGEIVEGSSVNLTCSSDANPVANYTWYKENETLPQGQGNIYNFISISPKDKGNYYCMSVNQYGRSNSSSRFIDVQYAPKLPSVSVTPGEIVEGSSVNLTCSSDANPAATYTWYKENEDSPKASGQIFTITDFRPQHSGNYYCEAQNSRGRHNSTLHPTLMASSVKSAAAGSITFIFLAVILLSAFLFIRRKRSLKQPSEPGDRPGNNAQLNVGPESENPSAAARRQRAEQQDDLFYASVTFSKTQEDCLYANIMSPQPSRHEMEDEECVEYTAVNINKASDTPGSGRQEPVEDPCALYSTVSKKYKA